MLVPRKRNKFILVRKKRELNLLLAFNVSPKEILVSSIPTITNQKDEKKVNSNVLFNI